MASTNLPSFLFFSSLALISIARSQERSPHGLAHENPMDLSPSAYEFFHPNSSLEDSCESYKCSPLPLAAQVESNEAHKSKYFGFEGGNERLSSGSIAGIVFGTAFAGTVVMGVCYVLRTRRANMSKAKSSTVQPQV